MVGTVKKIETIPIEGSSSFRADAGTLWIELAQTIDSMNKAFSDFNIVINGQAHAYILADRYDKRLAMLNITNMDYSSDGLIRIDYEGINNYELFYYTDGLLSSTEHYIDEVKGGTTSFSYIGGNLKSVTYVSHLGGV